MKVSTKKWPGFKAYNPPLVFSAACVLALSLSPSLHAQDNMQLAQLDSDFTALSLEQLMNIEVVSASKQAEPLQQAATAIFVLDGDTIRRSGVRTLPEALRLVPGLQVARVDSHTWVVTARGFSSTLSDKLEVLMDGRSLYTPLFSGVFWEVQDTLLEDIDRIEVIRGPGAALWGANAVNGVINIVTKEAGSSQGGMQFVGGGGQYDGYAGWRYGGELGDKGHYRAYVKTTQHKPQEVAGPADSRDRWGLDQAGFRTDLSLSSQDLVTIQGDIYQGVIYNKTVSEDETVGGGNLLTRWQHNYNEDENTTVQIYFDRTERDNKYNFSEHRNTFDIDIQHHFHMGTRQEFVLGGGYRVSSDDIGTPNPVITDFIPRSRDAETFNLYAQDQIQLLPNKLKLTLGAKYENNDFTGDEFQPSVRVGYTINKENTLWMGVSKAVRIPNRLDHDIQLSGGLVRFDGSEEFESEELIAYELGYRSLVTSTLSLDLALFYNEYDDLRGVAPSANPTIFLISNEGEGETQGGELVLRWRPDTSLQVMLSYQYIDVDIQAKPGSLDSSTFTGSDENDPQNMAMFTADWDINDHWSLHTSLRWVDELADQVVNPLTGQIVEEYFGVDASLMWSPVKSWQFSVTGKNLQDRSHPEFGGGVEIERSVHGQVTWNF